MVARKESRDVVRSGVCQLVPTSGPVPSLRHADLFSQHDVEGFAAPRRILRGLWTGSWKEGRDDHRRKSFQSDFVTAGAGLAGTRTAVWQRRAALGAGLPSGSTEARDFRVVAQTSPVQLNGISQRTEKRTSPRPLSRGLVDDVQHGLVGPKVCYLISLPMMFSARTRP